MKKITAFAVFGLFCVVCLSSASASEDAAFVSANALYKAGKYEQAFEAYRRLRQDKKENGEVYFNMGLCQAKMNADIEALYWFEKAKTYLPQDTDLSQNTDFVRSRLSQTPAAFAVPLWQRPLEHVPLPLLAAAAIGLHAFAWLLFGLRRLHGVSVSVAAIVAAAVVSLYAAAGYTVRTLEKASHVMIMQPTVAARFEPDAKAAEFFTLFGGDIVVREKTAEGWVRVRRSDGKQGWIADGDARRI